MPHDRDGRPHDGFHLRAEMAAAFQLHGLGPAFLHQASGIGAGLLRRQVVGHEGHVADQQGLGQAPGHGGAVMDHLVHGHAQGVGLPQHDHAQGIPHQHGIHMIVHEPGDGGVIGREHGQFALPLGLAEGDGGLFHGGAPLLRAGHDRPGKTGRGPGRKRKGGERTHVLPPP